MSKRLTREEKKRRQLERFYKQTEEAENGCLLWTGYVAKTGYGETSLSIGWKGVRRYLVHVAVFLLNDLPYDPTLDVGHKCHDADVDCPGGPCIHRRCVNLDHLKQETRSQNLKSGRGNGLALVWEAKHRGHEVSVNGAGKKRCLTCRRERYRRTGKT